MPRRLDIDGLEIMDDGAEEKFGVYVLPDYSPDPEENAKAAFPYVPTEKLRVRNVVCRSGREIAVCNTPELYPGLEVE